MRCCKREWAWVAPPEKGWADLALEGKAGGLAKGGCELRGDRREASRSE